MSTPWRREAWLLAGPPELLAAAEDVLAREPAERGPRALGPHAAFFKGSRLRPRSGLRHALRRALGLAELPRLQEFSNLEWLRAHGFLAPRPLLAGARWRAGRPRYQFLYTEFMPAASTLAELCAGPGRERLAPTLLALARDLAHLHALGFVHRDLFARNLLVPPGDGRCAFLDAWRGGPRRGLRGPAHDLGCLMLDGATLFTREEQALFLTTYEEECGRRGRRLPAGWPRRVAGARAAVYRRERLRRPEVADAWVFPGA